MRRKKALSDLIKKLKEYGREKIAPCINCYLFLYLYKLVLLGLSHRKGEELSDDLQLLPFTQPLTVTTPFSNDCDHYFYLSVSRMVALSMSMATPSKVWTGIPLYHTYMCSVYTYCFKAILTCMCNSIKGMSSYLCLHKHVNLIFINEY